MPLWVLDTLLKDSIFQIAVVIFIAAFAMFWWMIYQSKKNLFSDGNQADKAIIASHQEAPSSLTQEAKFQLLLENIIAINRRLDEIEKRLIASSSQNLSPGPVVKSSNIKDDDIVRKLDSIYKILSSLSIKNE